MNIEELKLVLDAINGIGEDTKQVVLVYFAYGLVKGLITPIGFLTALFLILRFIPKLTKQLSNSSDEEKARAYFVQHVRKTLDLNMYNEDDIKVNPKLYNKFEEATKEWVADKEEREKAENQAREERRSRLGLSSLTDPTNPFR